MSALVQEIKSRCPKFGARKRFAGRWFVVIRTEMTMRDRWLVTYELEAKA